MDEQTTEPGAATVREYQIRAELLDAARDKVAKVNRRLTKLNLPLYVLEVGETRRRPIYDDELDLNNRTIDGVPHRYEGGQWVPCAIIGYTEHVDIQVVGAVPRLADWEPVAVLTRDEHAGVVTRVWPGLTTEPDLSRYRGTEPSCAHCGKARQRNDTFVMRHTVTGELVEVGRNCLTAYTGIKVGLPVWLVYGDDGLDEMETWQAGGAGASADCYRVTAALAYAVAVVAEWGWVSRTMQRESFGEKQATADIVREALGGRGQTAAKLRAYLAPRVAEAAERALVVREHALHMADSDSSEYAVNMAAVARPDYVTPRNLGLLVSAVGSLARAEGRAVERKVRGESNWQGNVKDRLDLTLTVVSANQRDTDWGTTTLIVMVDDAGNRFKWWASGAFDWCAGDVVTLKGTVKAHEEYQERKETVLTRCKVSTHTAAKNLDRDLAAAPAATSPSGTFCGDPVDPACGPDNGKPWCDYHGESDPFGNVPAAVAVAS